LECSVPPSLENDDNDVEHGRERGEDVDLKLGIRNRFRSSHKLVLDFHQLREIGDDRLSCDWAKGMKLSTKSHSSDNRTGCIHLLCNHRPHFGRIVNFFNLNLDIIAARTTDDGTGLVATGNVTVVDSPFSDGGSGESDRVVRWLFFSQHNLPRLDAFEDAPTLSLPSGIVGALEEIDGSKSVFVGL
jgi:hypothetical protein